MKSKKDIENLICEALKENKININSINPTTIDKIEEEYQRLYNMLVPNNEEKEFEQIDENTYILAGSMPIYDVNKILKSNIPEGDYDTLSGYLQEELGRIPDEEENPIIETKELTFKIEEYEDKRILKVKVCKNEEIQE